MSMRPPSSLDHHHHRRSGQEQINLQQSLRSIPTPLPHDMLYLQHHQHQQKLHQNQRLVNDEDVYTLRQWPLPELNTHTSGCDGLRENLAAATYRQNLNWGLESTNSYPSARPELRHPPREFEFSRLQDDAARSRQAGNHSRIFPLQQQLIGNDQGKVRGRDGVFHSSNEVFGAIDDLLRGSPVAEPVNRADFQARDSKSFASLPTKSPALFLDHSRIYNQSRVDLGFLEPSSVYQAGIRESLGSILPAFQAPPDYLFNKQFNEESVYLEREGLQKIQRQSLFEFGSYQDNLHSYGGRQGRGDSAELQNILPRNILGAVVTDLYRHGDVNPNAVPLANRNLVSSITEFVDYQSVDGCNSDIIPLFNNFANEKDEKWSHRKRKKKAKASILLGDRSPSRHFRYRSPGRRDYIDDDSRKIPQSSDRKLDELNQGRLKGRLKFSGERASFKQTHLFESHTRVLEENESFKQHQGKVSKDCTPTHTVKSKIQLLTPKTGSPQHEKHMLPKGVKGNRHPPAGLDRKRPHNKIGNASKSREKEMPSKYRKIKEINRSSKDRAINRVYVVPSSSAPGQKNENKSVSLPKITRQWQQRNVFHVSSEQPANDPAKAVNGMDAHDIRVERTAETSLERDRSAQGVAQQLLESSQRVHTSSERSQSFQRVRPSDASSLLVVEPQVHQTIKESFPEAVPQSQLGSYAAADSVWKELEGRQTLDPFQVCLQGPNVVLDSKHQAHTSNIFIAGASADRHASKVNMPSSPDLQNVGEEEVNGSRRRVINQSLKSVKNCETGDFPKNEVSISEQKVTPVYNIISSSKYQSLDLNDCTLPDKVGLLSHKEQFMSSDSEISAIVANCLEHSREQALPSLQSIAHPKNGGMSAGGSVTLNTDQRLQNKQNTMTPVLNLEEFPSCQFGAKELAPTCLHEKQKSSSLFPNLSKLSSEYAEITKSNDKGQKEVLSFHQMEKQPFSKHQPPNFTPKPSSRPYFSKHPQKRSVWRASPATRTWHRDNTLPSTCAHEVPVIAKAHPTASQSLQVSSTITSTTSASYVRKGNSLVRTSGLPGNPSAISLKSLNQSETHTMTVSAKAFSLDTSSGKSKSAVNSHLGSGASEKNYGIHTIVDMVAASENASKDSHLASSESLSAAPVEVKLDSSIHQNVHSELASSRDKDEMETAVYKAVDALGSNVRNEGLLSPSNTRQRSNNMISSSMLYVRSKANQLVAAPVTVTEDMEDQAGKGSREKQLQGSYVRKNSNQLVRSNFVPNSENKDLLNDVAYRSVPNPIIGRRKGKPQVPGVLSTKLARVLSQKKVVGSCVPLVWTLSGTKCHSTIKESASSLVPWKKPGFGIGLRSRLLKALPKGKKGSFLSLISRKLQDMRISQPLYTRSADGFSLHRSGVMSLGGANLKWTKSIDKKSKLAREETTKAVAAVAKERREKKAAAVAARKARSDRRAACKSAQNLKPNSRRRIVLVGLVRYSMDPTKRTLQRLPESEEVSDEISRTVPSDKLDVSPITPRRASIGGAVYVRVGNGNQLIRDPKTSLRALANEKIRWSLHYARSRAQRKQQYCQFFTRFGKCNKEGGRCPYIHDPEKVAVCTKFLNGTCTDVNCLLTHKVIPERMPDCSFFLQGLCINECCPYRHVNVNSMAPVCQGFLKGYCIDGDRCNKKHTNVCSVYSETGACPDRTKCKFHHPKKRDISVLGTGRKLDTKKRKRYFSNGGLASLHSDAPGVTHSVLMDGNLATNSECIDFISLSDILSDPQNTQVTERSKSFITRKELSILSHDNSSIEDIDRLIKPAFVFHRTFDLSKDESI